MKSNLKSISEKIARDLKSTYYYYIDVYFDFIVEAVENTLKDFELEIKPLTEIHKHIKLYYI